MATPAATMAPASTQSQRSLLITHLARLNFFLYASTVAVTADLEKFNMIPSSLEIVHLKSYEIEFFEKATSYIFGTLDRTLPLWTIASGVTLTSLLSRLFDSQPQAIMEAMFSDSTINFQAIWKDKFDEKEMKGKWRQFGKDVFCMLCMALYPRMIRRTTYPASRFHALPSATPAPPLSNFQPLTKGAKDDIIKIWRNRLFVFLHNHTLTMAQVPITPEFETLLATYRKRTPQVLASSLDGKRKSLFERGLRGYKQVGDGSGRILCDIPRCMSDEKFAGLEEFKEHLRVVHPIGVQPTVVQPTGVKATGAIGIKKEAQDITQGRDICRSDGTGSVLEL